MHNAKVTPPIFSIIIPIYNVEKYLRKCLNSLLAQEFKDYELILVDDGSLDACPDICDEYAANYSNILVIHQQNQGISGARNTGIKAAKGKYLCFVDPDDRVTEDYFSSLVSVLEREAPDIIVFGYYKETFKKDELVICKQISLEEIRFNLMSNAWHAYAWNKVFKREVFSNVEFPVGKYFEDAYVIPYLFLGEQKVVCIEKPLYCYNCKNTGSITVNRNSKREFDLFLAWIIRLQSDYVLARQDRDYFVSKCYGSAKRTYLYNLVDKMLNEEQVEVLETYIREALKIDALRHLPNRRKAEFLFRVFLNRHTLFNRLYLKYYAWKKYGK